MDRLDVAPDGDLILVVSNKLELRVYSCILRLTSPVFKAMLGPDFAEGKRQGTATSPSRLLLPEDDTTGMRFLSLVLHHTNYDLPQTIERADLLRFAVSVDKYHCSTAVLHLAQAWLSAFQTPIQINDVVLCAAYLLDDAKSFARLTDTVIRNSVDPSRRRLNRQVLKTEMLLELRMKIQDAFEDKVGVVRSELSQSITICAKAITDLFKPWYDHLKGLTPDLDLEDEGVHDSKECSIWCQYSQNIVRVHLRALARARIWPRSSWTGSLEKVLQATQSFDLIDDQSVMWCESEACGEAMLLDHIEPAINTLKEKAAALSMSLCLDCTKRGGKCTADQTCRIGYS